MVLGQVVGMEAGAVIGLDEAQSIGVKLAERKTAAVEVIEDAEIDAHGVMHAGI
jgi:hypothetical protein